MKLRTPAYIFIPLTMLAILLTFAMVTPVENIVEPGFKGMIDNSIAHIVAALKQGVVWAVMAISLVMLLIINAINKLVESQKFQQLTEDEKAEYLAKKKKGYIKNLLSSANQRQTKEEEEAIIIDHGFDGIKELDNALPQWWLSLFWLGIVFCVVYLLAYGFTDFAHSDVEYAQEEKILNIKDSIWAVENDITIEGAVNKFNDPAVVEQGKLIFNTQCTLCHMEGGKGGIGPNLTDDYWISQVNDSLFYNIYAVIYDGSPTNPQMRAFGQRGELSGLNIEKVASYVYYINQVEKTLTPADGAAAPQGELVEAWKAKN
ncbi:MULTISPECIES: cbb3-type cytochrome c oxidase N-terminal domain-containing protein [Weeksella]|uniref:Cytochrome c class I n=1 Tax=Weeksella virosa (strain ATCC 43766 / DSM 16922 / JCM 21250 / CCUG 30538 / CDC 9751 / IAM 14551 / NBRC 16016 / NCTC 11634 / CL345/78) TaxID=865938 RepID=F0P142_WEEVC|nr:MULTISPECIES: cbb3-type cytochrome c oxidase N-terminal domain-containing protein [Weeksella]ADX67541.1 cytochrome c class I [Weeksella virosa DSM 16922]MDK7375307.1 cbb3-type cytochrome c oxidase N-terminal domain-containing protein [Weeksella virosa]MDK7676041.1 cbb3-type cytochrome c oxidase N-terminal domain-containing protein [Weeksella virosa]OFM84752.1 cytochrome C [Weeksella sp. HMSC059D05]SUP53836.1 Cytochrome c oxidase subunit III [Weeksella virosa]